MARKNCQHSQNEKVKTIGPEYITMIHNMLYDMAHHMLHHPGQAIPIQETVSMRVFKTHNAWYVGGVLTTKQDILNNPSDYYVRILNPITSTDLTGAYGMLTSYYDNDKWEVTLMHPGDWSPTGLQTQPQSRQPWDQS